MRQSNEVGPECRECGCNATYLIVAGGGSRPYAKFQCDHCGHIRTIGTEPQPGRGVTFERVLCPSCGSRKARVTHSAPARETHRVRYHKCADCGHNFKSVER